MFYCLAGVVSIAFTIFARTGTAQNSKLSNSTAGCADVDCPVDDVNDSLSSCKVADNTLLGIGISSYTSDLLDVSPTWTLGLSRLNSSVEDTNGSVVQRTFYVGKSPDDNLPDDAVGCAVFIVANEGDRNATLFSGGHANENRGWIGPSCTQSGGLSESCLSALHQETTGAIDTSGWTCKDIANTLNSEILEACNPNGTANVSEGQTSILSRSSTFYAVPITGEQAPEPIMGSQNSTSDCWPTLPKTNDLTEIFSFNISTSGSADEVIAALRDITPVLNLWYADGSVEFEALCISPVLVSTHDAQTQVANSGITSWSGSWLFTTTVLLTIALA